MAIKHAGDFKRRTLLQFVLASPGIDDTSTNMVPARL
jgi:hypothetical protein